MSGRTKKTIALASALLFAFANGYAAAQATRLPVLRHVAVAHVQGEMAGKAAPTVEEFAAAKDKMLADIDDSIKRISESKLDDKALRAKSLERIQASSKALEVKLIKFVQKGMDGKVVEKAIAAAKTDKRYSRCLAKNKDERAALAACLALDMRTAKAQAEQLIATKTKAELVADLQAARERITALAYDGSDYDEYFEWSWYCLQQRDAIFFILFIPAFVLDVAATPVVFVYKMIRWIFLD